MEEKLMEERKNMLLDLMKDPTYVPMKGGSCGSAVGTEQLAFEEDWRCFLVSQRSSAASWKKF